MIHTRRFTMADQDAFAAASGDCNPMHMDALAARRTAGGLPVVHGVHTLLWALDRLFATGERRAPSALEVKFLKMVHVGDEVAATIEPGAAQTRIALSVDGLPVASATLRFGGDPAPAETWDAPVLQPATPQALPFADMAGQSGRIPFAAQSALLGQMVPAATAALGAQRVAALACTSFLVGMVCPGLHSIFAGLSLSAAALGEDVLAFRVRSTDPRFHLVGMAVAGGGWAGTVKTHARPEPARQADLASVQRRVTPGEFAGAEILVIGGSRGIGELVAKIAAAGGAAVTITYAAGQADARAVQAEILAGGGACTVLHYDALAPDPAAQLAALAQRPDHTYYLATPSIFGTRSAVFGPAQFELFNRFYVTGFFALCQALRARWPTGGALFYPSTVAVETRPRGMTAYAMAKAAGEVLCADLQAYEQSGPILVHRLPRLPTDQTATVFATDEVDAVSVMLPIVREMHRLAS